MKKKVFCILLSWMMIGVQTVLAQDSSLLSDNELFRLKEVAKQVFKNYHSTHNLSYFDKKRTLKQVESQTICIAPMQYTGYDNDYGYVYRFLNRPNPIDDSYRNRTMPIPTLYGKTPIMERLKADFMRKYGTPSETKPDTAKEPELKVEDLYFEVKKVSSKNITVLYQNEEYKINTNDRYFDQLMLKSDRDEILAQIAKLYQDAEQKVIDERRNNLRIYQEQIKKFRQGSSGPIAINKGKRKYDGSVPFGVFGEEWGVLGIETFLDETFVFKKDAINKVADRYKYELESMQNDTIGLFLNRDKNGREEELFINLRTGQVLSNHHYNVMMSRGLLESTTYLNNLAKAESFEYDGTYSIQELLDSYRFKVKYPQTIYDALIGEKVYVLKQKDYEEDEITEISTMRGDYIEICTKKNGAVGLDRIIGARWFEKLQTMVGKKVVLKMYNDMLYKEDLADMMVYTIDNFEAKEYLFNGFEQHPVLELAVNLSNGSEKKVINALTDCWLLTHPFDLNNPIEANGQAIALPYDYLMENAPKMPAAVRQKRERISRSLDRAIDKVIDNYDYEKEMKKRMNTTHQYECRYCHRKLKATGKGDVFESGQCPVRSSGITYMHVWSKID